MSSLVYMLDTNTVSYLINRRSPAARKRLAEVQDGTGIALSAITEAEISYGLEKKPGARRLSQDFRDFCEAVQIFPWTRAAAQGYGKLRAQLESSGKSLHVMDMLIAAHAHALGAILVTRDKDFNSIAGMVRTENWATDV